jgi:hypothetical protein
VTVTLVTARVLASAAVSVIPVLDVVHEIPLSVGYDHVGVKLYGFVSVMVLLDQDPTTTVYNVVVPGFARTNSDELSIVSGKVIPEPYPAVIDTVCERELAPEAATTLRLEFEGVHVSPVIRG